MHRRFRELLDTAVGESHFVLAVNLDIRGFSEWSRKVESREMILYLTKVYPRVIDWYFADEWFFKPTGDGLLLVRAFEEPELPSLVDKTLRDCFEIVDSFSTLCEGEPMINFETPSDVGIGLAQGAASRLWAPDPEDSDIPRTLDYSGRVLNLASRLMELARPRGVVIDSGFGAGLIPADVAARLSEETGYVRGVSPEDEVRVYFDPELTQIPKSFKQKPGEVDWHSQTLNLTLKQIEGHTLMRQSTLEKEPRDLEQVTCKITHPSVSSSGRKVEGMLTTFSYACVAVKDGTKTVVSVNFPELGKYLRAQGVKGPWPVAVRIQYPT